MTARRKIMTAAIAGAVFCAVVQAQNVPFWAAQEEPVDSSQQIADRIVSSKVPVLVDFWAPWCGPCRMLNPILKTLEKAYRGRVEFLKVNVDVNQRISAFFQIQGIPAVFIIKDKAVKKAFIGYRPEADYRKALDEVLAMPSVKPAVQDTVKKKDSVRAAMKGKVVQ
jgi:thioredoxin 1